MNGWPELEESRKQMSQVLDELKRRGVTADAIECGAIRLTGLRYPLPPKPDGEPEPVLTEDDDLTFASAG